MPLADPRLTRLRARTAFSAPFALTLLLLSVPAALANGPRWVTGPPYFNTAGAAVIWYTTSPLYFTDPGNLSASVNHAAADALVAAAAGVWNIPTSAIVLARGGILAEHVSSANSYLSSSGPVFPSDVQAANSSAIQIAVLYDSDGSITDMLLGSGASSPAECRQNAVTEDVDSIVPAGFIQHAILVLNGRCTGPAPQQQLQMQYQLERAFGRILGLDWSQTNDNVFTRSPAPTTVQAQNWPILHPIDIICGAYTYQCLPSPFTLRDDDIASISGLYPLFAYMPFPTPTPAPGKTWSYIQAGYIYGYVTFPTGEGMQGVNIVLQRWRGGTAGPQPWQDVSTVSGFAFQSNAGNPVTGSSSSLAASLGSSYTGMQGYYQLPWVPDADPLGSSNGPMRAVLTTEPINPLYTGAYSVGPYTQAAVSPSGSAQSKTSRDPIWPYTASDDPSVQTFSPPADAAATCDTSADGTETAPASFPATGWSPGVLCAHGHSAWFSFSAQAGRTATLEVTALDESGYATTSKAMPLLGVWNSADPTGTLPTVAATPSAFNTIALGNTATTITTTQPQSLRFVIADARGDGRPDYAYQARILYADTIQPAVTSVNGGQITITGTGFRPGNQVTVNGVPAAVSSWTANTIVAIAPPLSAFRAPPSAPVDIAVTDLATGGSTTMSAALTYSSSVTPDILLLISAPPATLPVGTPATFAVRVLLGDGVTPIAGLPVSFTWTGPAQLSGCAASPCILLTDATGLANATVTPTAFGAITLQASAVGATQIATFTAIARSVSALQPVEYIAANSAISAPLMWTPQLAVIQNAAPASGIEVDWSGTIGFSLSTASSTTAANGIASASATLGPLASGAQAAAQACAWNSSPPSLCATFTAIAVDPSALRIVVVSGAGQTVTAPAPFAPPTFAPIVFRVTDTAGHSVAGALVNLYQTVDAAQMPCPTHGPCPIPPTLAQSTATAISDVNGLFSVIPTQLPAAREVTNIAAATGSQGFAALSLTQQP